MLRRGHEGTTQIAIVGLGFIGGSIGLALRQAGGEVRIIGHDRDPSQAKQAQKMGAVDDVRWNLIRACEEADMIVLALPPEGLRATLEAVAADLKPGCLVTDTATVKAEVLHWAEELLPPHVAFVGGDPIVQTPGSGLDGARADLFQGQLYCLSPAPNAPSAAVQLMVDWVGRLGAYPYFLDAEEHDGLRAAVDHLPALLTTVLLGEVARSPAPREMKRLRGQVLTQIMALMGDEAGTYRTLCLTNASAIAHWLQTMRDRLGELQQLIQAADAEGLTRLFEQALGGEEPEPTARELPRPSMWGQWFGVPQRLRRE